MPDMNMQTFEELQRHQLVTEFDIQSQSELDDYQVKLNNVSNPTQAQDNLVVGVDGESLSHWNESVDFDTWVKARIETSGKRGLLIHGNDGLSGGSSGIDVFPTFFEDFSGDLSQFTTTTGFSISDGKAVTTSNNARLISTNTSPASNYRLIAKASVNSAQGYYYSRMLVFSDTTTYAALNYIHAGSAIGSTYFGSSVGSAPQVYSVTLDGNYHMIEISRMAGDATVKFDAESHTYSSGYPTADSYIHFGTDVNGGGLNVDYVFYAKNTTTEPTVQISTPKNISTALKSFGRAG